MNCKATGCNGYIYDESTGLCQFCLNEHRQKQQKSDLPIIRQMAMSNKKVTQKPVVQQISTEKDVQQGKALDKETMSNNVQHSNPETIAKMVKMAELSKKEKPSIPIVAHLMVAVAKVLHEEKMCSKCKTEPKADWSNSYCKSCYAAWRRKRRSANK